MKRITLKGILGCHLVATLWRHPNISQHAVNPWLHPQMPGLPSSARLLPVWVPCEPCKDEEGKMPCFHGCVFPDELRKNNSLVGGFTYVGDKARFSQVFYVFLWFLLWLLLICWIVFEVDVQSVNPLVCLHGILCLRSVKTIVGWERCSFCGSYGVFKNAQILGEGVAQCGRFQQAHYKISQVKPPNRPWMMPSPKKRQSSNNQFVLAMIWRYHNSRARGFREYGCWSWGLAFVA